MKPDDGLDPDAPPSAEETAAAEALRAALEEPAPVADERAPRALPSRRAPASDASDATRSAVEFARAASLAHAPRPIAEAEHRAIVTTAIAQGGARRLRRRRSWSGGVIAVVGGLALAAGIALVVRTPPMGAAPAAVWIEPLVRVRSTEPLFREPFARTGGESARIDRIAASRGGDLRDNRFAAWG